MKHLLIRRLPSVDRRADAQFFATPKRIERIFERAMWTPTTEDEIIDACSNGSLEETVIFDAKREVPPKNSDIAKDVAALANTAGGTIIFGIGEDETGRPTVPTPLLVRGQRERIESIIRTSISEVPVFKISQIESLAYPEQGYLVLVVPPSDRSPHMVEVKGERRFYGRGETGNYPLSEVEVARLYERRKVSASSLVPLLDKRVDECPIKDHQGFAHLHIIIRPVTSDDELLDRALDSRRGHSEGLHEILLQVMNAGEFRRQYHPDFNITGAWTRRPDGYLNDIWKAIAGGRNDYALTLEANFDGGGYLFCSRAAESVKEGQQQVKWFIADIVAGNTFKFLDFFRRIYTRAKYFGMVDIGVKLTGLHNSVCIETRHSVSINTYRYDREDYSKIVRVSAMELEQDPTGVAVRLVMPLISTISQSRNDPFKERI